MPESLEETLAFTVRLARTAAEVALHHYGRVERLTKTHAAANQEAVTQADRDVQAHIVAALKAKHPADGVIGEEDDSGAGITARIPDPAARVWVIDPIDGTNNFIGGFGNFAVCIALLERGMPVLGVVHDVTRNTTYFAAKGVGMFVESPGSSPRKAACLSTALADSSILMLTSNLLKPDGSLPAFASRWLGQTNWKIRVIGSAALEAAYVAAGIAHGAVTMNGKLWDVAAPAALVLEAGGEVVSLRASDTGRPVFPFDLRNYNGAKVPFLASAPGATAALLDELGR
jgi:myo-inositol-1(or 4)-monophosphatase